MLFKNIIPIETLGGMPLPFLHRLRDIRIKQLEDQNKTRMNAMQPQTQNRQNPNTVNNYGGGIPQSAIEDIIDEIC